MAGIKRRQPEEDAKTSESGKVKKLKSSEPTKAEAKFALKVARGKSKSEPKSEGTTKVNGKENVPKKEKSAKNEVKRSAKPVVERPKPARKISDMPESDTTEDENGFYGFSANSDAIVDASISESEADEDMPVEQPAKKQQKEHKSESKSKQPTLAKDGVPKDGTNGGVYSSTLSSPFNSNHEQEPTRKKPTRNRKP
jgi:pumilio family protein 6